MMINTDMFRRLGVVASFLIVSLILWNTYDFFQKFKNEERMKMEILASSYKRLNKTDLNAEISLETKIIESNHNIPMLITTKKDSIIYWTNLDSVKSLKKDYLRKQLSIMKSQNEPIVVAYQNQNEQFIYYRDSDLLTKLKYYPIALILILLLFSSVIYLFLRSNKMAEQNRLWTGMAKETAHQIGTPLSSLLGWIEILRLNNTDEAMVSEIEKDVTRLRTIAERFSKIGSEPTFNNENVVAVVRHTLQYLQSRSSKHLQFTFKTDSNELFANINLQLMSWVIENLIKNAIDATSGKGEIDVRVQELPKQIKIKISDTGKGMTKNTLKKMFEPGFTTKKRGWGLGLSLAKRIVEDYHKGRIFVEKTEVGKGTILVIILQKSSV